jgi:hypothetical protein
VCNLVSDIEGRTQTEGPLRKLRHRWEENINMDLREIGWDGMDWINQVQDMDHGRALVNTVMNLPGR